LKVSTGKMVILVVVVVVVVVLAAEIVVVVVVVVIIVLQCLNLLFLSLLSRDRPLRFRRPSNDRGGSNSTSNGSRCLRQ
jgi:hypothetical protein